jgi:hypothetical protein
MPRRKDEVGEKRDEDLQSYQQQAGSRPCWGKWQEEGIVDRLKKSVFLPDNLPLSKHNYSHVSIVNMAGNANTKFTAPNPSDA